MTPELSSSGVPQSATDVLSGYYVDAAKRIRQIVLHPTGQTASSQGFKQARAAVMLSQIDAELMRLKKQAAGWLGPNLTQAMIDGVKRGEQQIKDLGIAPANPSGPSGSLDKVDKGTMNVLARDAYSHLAGAADSMGKNAAKILRATAQHNISEAEVNRILAGGVIEGQPRHTIRELRDALAVADDGKVVITDRNGDPMEFDAGYYARMVVRTKTREATVMARHQRLRQEGINLVSIVGRVSKNFCTAYLGMVFSLDGKSSKYPSLEELPSGGPPFHPNCSKSTRPYVEELATPNEEDLADGVDGADKLMGVDAATAQKRFKDLQIYQQVKADYATTAKRLFGKKAA